MFNEVSLGISSNGMSPPQIGWRDVQAWSELMDEPCWPWECRTIVLLGLIRANVQAEKSKSKSEAARAASKRKTR